MKVKYAEAATRQELATQQERTRELRSRVGNLEAMAARNAKDKTIAAQVLPSSIHGVHMIPPCQRLRLPTMQAYLDGKRNGW